MRENLVISPCYVLEQGPVSRSPTKVCFTAQRLTHGEDFPEIFAINDHRRAVVSFDSWKRNKLLDPCE